MEIRSDRWNTIVQTNKARAGQATNNGEKKGGGKEEEEEEEEKMEPITGKFLAKVFPKLQWNVCGHPRRKKIPREDAETGSVDADGLRTAPVHTL